MINIGTNFYLRDDKLYEQVKQFKDTYDIDIQLPEIHIAKTSYGWKPLFQKNMLFSSVKELKTFYDTSKLQIFDEYDNLYNWEQFTERVLEFADKNSKSHTNVFIDEEGYEFKEGEWF